MCLFVLLRPQTLSLKELALTEALVGSRPESGYPAVLSNSNLAGPAPKGHSSKRPFEEQTFPFLKRREIATKTYCSVQTMPPSIKERAGLIKVDSRIKPGRHPACYHGREHGGPLRLVRLHFPFTLGS